MPLSSWEGRYFIYIGRLKYVGDLKQYDFYGIILLSKVLVWLWSVGNIYGWIALNWSIDIYARYCTNDP